MILSREHQGETPSVRSDAARVRTFSRVLLGSYGRLILLETERLSDEPDTGLLKLLTVGRTQEELDVPSLILNAQDDPFVAGGAYPVAEAAANPRVTLEMPPYGGHVGFALSGGRWWSELRTTAFVRELFGDRMSSPGRTRRPAARWRGSARVTWTRAERLSMYC